MKQISNVRPAKRLKYFVKKIPAGLVILGYVESYKILLLEISSKSSLLLPVTLKEELKVIAEKDIEEIMKKKTSSSTEWIWATFKSNFHSQVKIWRS